MVNTFKLYETLKQAFPPESAEALAHVLSEMTEALLNTVTKEDFSELKAAVVSLTQAQERTEQRLEELARSQDALAQAQQRTELRLESLARSQGELAQAQKRTEDRLDALVRTTDQGFTNFGRRLDALFMRSGSSAEAAFRDGLRKILEEAGYAVEEYEGRDLEGFINHDPGRSYQLDVVIRDGTLMVVEIKSSASSADVVRFARTAALYEKQTGRKVAKKVLIAAAFRPEAHARAAELGVVLGLDTSAVTEG